MGIAFAARHRGYFVLATFDVSGAEGIKWPRALHASGQRPRRGLRDQRSAGSNGSSVHSLKGGAIFHNDIIISSLLFWPLRSSSKFSLKGENGAIVSLQIGIGPLE